MFTNNVNGNTNGAGANTADVLSSSAPSETADMFTKLLVAQIRNQDPLSPSDPTQFVNQLSQLSQTEALQNMAKMNSTSASVLQSLQVLALGAQVGSDVVVATDTLQLDGEKVAGSITLSSPSATNELVLTGADGVQHKVALGSHGAGAVPFSIDPVALGLAPGKYAVSVTAANGQQPEIEVNGRLDAVRMTASGGILLKVAGVGEVAPSYVTGFNGKANPLAAAASI